MRFWTSRGTDAQTLRAWDGIMVFWVVFWLVVGVASGYQVVTLTGLADSAVSSGHALQTAGSALRRLVDVPVIGDTTAQLGEQVAEAAQGIVQNGSEARRSIRVLGLLIGLAIGLGPIGPVLLFYLPMRLSRRQEVREIATALRDEGAGPQLQRYLATRAVTNLSLRDLQRVSGDPYVDLASGRHLGLARAELRRLGLDPAAVT
jgi:hypothetical protein